MPVMLETSRLVGTSRGVLMRVSALVVVVPRAEGHHDFFERAVAGPLAEAVDRALDLAGAVLDGRQAVGHRQAEVVVAVNADHRLVDVRHALDEIADDAAVVRPASRSRPCREC